MEKKKKKKDPRDLGCHKRSKWSSHLASINKELTILYLGSIVHKKQTKMNNVCIHVISDSQIS